MTSSYDWTGLAPSETQPATETPEQHAANLAALFDYYGKQAGMDTAGFRNLSPAAQEDALNQAMNWFNVKGGGSYRSSTLQDAALPAAVFAAPFALSALAGGALGGAAGAGAAGASGAGAGLLDEGVLGGSALTAGGGIGGAAGDALTAGAAGVGGTGYDPTTGGWADPGVTGAGYGETVPGVGTVQYGPNGEVIDAATTGGAYPGGEAATATSSAAKASALQNILSGNGSAADWASLAGGAAGIIGKALPGILGAIGANKQAGQLSDLADKYLAIGGPSRGRYEASMSPGFDALSIPGYKDAVDNASESQMHALSTTGNPFDNPTGLIDAQKRVVAGTALPAIQNYQSQNASTGGYGALTGAVPGIAQQAIGSGTGGVYGGIGSAIGNVTKPQMTMADWIKAMNPSGGNNVFGKGP